MSVVKHPVECSETDGGSDFLMHEMEDGEFEEEEEVVSISEEDLLKELDRQEMAFQVVEPDQGRFLLCTKWPSLLTNM